MTTPANKVVTLGAWITGVGLVLLALQCFIFPGAAAGYGVSPVDEKGFAFLLATGMRDFALGLTTLFLLIRYRQALGFFFLILTIVPIADTFIVLRYGNSLMNLAPHVIGLLGLLAFSWFAFREQSGD